MTRASNDLMPNAKAEVEIRQALLQVSLGRKPADTILRVARVLDAGTGTWIEDAEIVISGRRIAYVGPRGSWPGTAKTVVERPKLSAVPGFGEVHKHIESSHLTPEYEAALVIPHGCTWACEASHEYSNVNGARNLEFWSIARKAGSPMKIFPLPGSAVPPTAWEYGGGYFGYDEQAEFMQTAAVAGLDEVMDWPAVCNADNPSHKRLWGMIEATMAARGVVEGHAAGITDLPNVNAFAAAGLSSDHEAWTAEEAWTKLRAGLFLEIRVHSMPDIVKGLLERGLQDWSQVAFATDDRSAWDTMKLGATDHNVRTAIAAGLSPEKAIQCVTINPARHMRLEAQVGLIAAGRYADIVLLDDLASLKIHEVWADGECASAGLDYTGTLPQIDWPDWAGHSVHIDRKITAKDFALFHEGPMAKAALLRPFHWAPEFITTELAVLDGQVQRDTERHITKFAIIDRHTGSARVAKMFWLGTGPATPDTALGCTVAHDQHNLWIVGSSDQAMADVANKMRETQGGWVLASGGQILSTVPYEIGGLMTARPAAELKQDMDALYAAAETIEWMFEPSFSPRWWKGFPERLQFATLTCAPWAWALVAPSDTIPEGFVNVQTGETHKVVW